MTKSGASTLLVLLAALGAPAAVADFKSVSGAIGFEDRARMMRLYDDYNLHLAFANAKGEFLADVRPAIRGAPGALHYFHWN